MRRIRVRLLGDIVETSLNRHFQRMGEFVGLHPLPFLVIPVFVAVLLSTGVLQGRIERDVHVLFTPVGAPSREESKAEVDFWRVDGNASLNVVRGFHLLFYVKHAADSNLLSHNRSDFVLAVHQHITKELNYTYGGREHNFGDRMCDRTPICSRANKPAVVFLNVFSNKKLLRNPNIRIKYPVLDAFGVKLFLMNHIFGVPAGDNESEPLREAGMIRLQYVVDISELNVTDSEFEAFRDASKSYVDAVRGTRDVEVYFFGWDDMSNELQRNTLACLPYLSATIVCIVAFTILSTITPDGVTSKPWEAFLGIVACGMAMMSTFGLLFYCGYAFNVAVSVMPFLAFAIGIDDTFMALSAWHATDPSLPPHKRLSLSLRDSGTAITVTSLTDVVLFGLCALSSTEAITVFSVFTAVAMAFDYVYQLTFFSAVMAYAGRREAKKLHSCAPFCWPARKSVEAPPAIAAAAAETDLRSQFVQKKLPDASRPELLMSRFLRSKLAPALNHSATKIGVFLVYVFYLAVSAYGCTRLRLDLSPSKNLLDDSPMQVYCDLQKRYLWEYVQPAIYVRKAPDFRNETEQGLFEDFLKDVESSVYSRGNDSTVIWYREYQNYIQYIDHTPEQFYEYLKEFLQVYVHAIFRPYLRWRTLNGTRYEDDPNATVSAFAFYTGFTTLDEGWQGRLDLLRAWRNVSRRYPRYDVVFFEVENFYSDQYDTLDAETIQQVGIALLAMTLMAAVFIPDLSSVFWIGWTLLSMDFGVVGMLTLWGCDLDVIVMMNILMSLDFAVEYAAHVCHRYYISKERAGADKVIDTLAAVGWPVTQGALAALLAVLPLVFVRSYIVRAFFRTVILVVGIGLVHALCFLPVFVSSVSRSRYVPPKSAAKVRRDRDDAKTK